MARSGKEHRELVDGAGKCSVPMWSGYGIEAGFCDEPAFGKQPNTPVLPIRWDGYDPNLPYASGLACPAHGGPQKE